MALGTSSKTVDLDLEKRIAKAKEDYNDCRALIQVTKNLATQTTGFVQAQTAASTLFERLSRQGTTLQHEFSVEHKLFDMIATNALVVVSALTSFNSEVSKFLTQEFDPLWVLLRHHESVRVEYDVCRIDFERVRNTSGPKVALYEAKFQEAQARLQRSSHDVSVKLTALESGKVCCA